MTVWTERFYRLCGALGALCILMTLLVQLAAIFGRPFGLLIDGYDSYAGYFLAGGSFLAFAYALRCGDHIRVTLIIGRLKGRARYAVEVVCLVIASLLTVYFAWFSIRLAWVSWATNDVSQNIDATPLWIPQSTMALGVAAMAIAFIEELVLALLRRQLPSGTAGEIARTE